jgi:Uma2 family endonuclease
MLRSVRTVWEHMFDVSSVAAHSPDIGSPQGPGGALVPLGCMRTLVLDPSTAGFDELLERRSRSGLDRLDEVWAGVLHMIPAPSLAHARIAQQLAELMGPVARAAGLESAMHEFNLGDSEQDFRVPDGALHRPGAAGTWLPTAALVVEIVSPGDESWEKLPFYAAHDVEEVLIVDPGECKVHWLELAHGEYRDVRRSGLIDLGPDELSEQIDWPPIEDS